ncbi:MAG: Clp protease/crotonase-like domain-containing protein [Planctomycetota bacterium]
MARYSALTLAVLISFSNCFADTFTHRRTGETFSGYVTRIKKHNKTQVRTEKKKPQYVDLTDYEIRHNYLGRKNKVFTFSIHDSIDLACETHAFEKAIAAAANQGPFFILIEIDTPGGRTDLVNRICTAITKLDNCLTVAFISADSFGGAYSTGAAIALACDRLYMADNTAIGGAGKQTSPTTTGPNRPISPTARFILPPPSGTDPSALLPHITSLAERDNRPTVVARAMLDELIELVEVTENQEAYFIELADHRPGFNIVRTWSKNGSLLQLTASEAVYCGIADGIIPSAEQLLKELNAPQARIVQNKDCIKARRKFERAKKQFDEILPAIPLLEARADMLLDELNNLQPRLNNQRIMVDLRRDRSYWDYRRSLRTDKKILEEMEEQQKTLTMQLASILKNLNAKYKTALRLAKAHEDLNANIEALTEGLTTTATKRQVARRMGPKSAERMTPPMLEMRHDGTNPIRGPFYSAPKGAYRPAPRR